MDLPDGRGLPSAFIHEYGDYCARDGEHLLSKHKVIEALSEYGVPPTRGAVILSDLRAAIHRMKGDCSFLFTQLRLEDRCPLEEDAARLMRAVGLCIKAGDGGSLLCEILNQTQDPLKAASKEWAVEWRQLLCSPFPDVAKPWEVRFCFTFCFDLSI